MTGYGQGAAGATGLRVTVDVRSVNNRFADVRARIPDALAAIEAEIRRRVLARVRRGRVDVDITLEREQGRSTLTLNRTLVDSLVVAARGVSRECGIPGALDLPTLFRIPGVVQVAEASQEIGDEGRNAVMDALERALEAHDAERSREGEMLRSDLIERLTRMESLVASVSARATAVPAAARRKLEDRIQALTAGLGIDPARLAQEAAVLADRADVTEEVVRLQGHLSQARVLLETPDGETVGKRLDFLLQEIGRETNTLGSKSADLEISRHALDLKSEAERIREQIQNLE